MQHLFHSSASLPVVKEKINKKLAIGQLWCIMNMQLQKEVISIQKQQARVQPQNTWVKKDLNSKVAAKKWL